MNNYPVFFLPKGEIMITAKVEADEIKLISKTLFPSNKRYYISESGLAACLDKEKRLLIFGQLNNNGEFDFIKILPFPSIISPKALCIYKENIILGGENDHNCGNEIESSELVVSYSICQDKFFSVEMPLKQKDKCVDDLLISGTKIIAVDNEIYPKFLLEYDFLFPNSPQITKSYCLPENGSYERIKKGTQNESILALFSSTIGLEGGGIFINIFIKGDYNNYIRLSQTSYIFRKTNEKSDKYYWRDILMIPGKDVLLISADEAGIGIYYIDYSLFDHVGSEDSESIFYFNFWNKKVIKLLMSPNDNDHIIVILQDGESESLNFSYAYKSIEDVLDRYEDENYEPMDDWRDDFNIVYSGEEEYCDACQSSPCMCSDREQSSTTYDF